MKKIKIFLFTVIFFSLCGCKWQVPTSFGIRTGASYNFCVGDITKDFSELFSATSLLSAGTTGSADAQVYDYFPGKTGSQCQKYLVKIPIQEIPVDFTAFFNETKLASSITNLSFDKKITIPAIDASANQSIDSAVLMTGINTSLATTGTTGSAVSFAINFDSIRYISGTLNFTGGSSGIVILKRNGNLIAQENVSGGKASIPLTARTLYGSGMTIEYSGGSVSYTLSVSPDSKIDRIKGLTTSNPIVLPASANVSTGGTSAEFVDCEIGTGSLDVNLTIPNAWTNVTVGFDVNLTGSISASAPSVNSSSNSVKLDKKIISNGTTTVKSNISLSFANSDVNFAAPIKMQTSANINSYNSVTLNIPDLNTNINQNENLSNELRDNVTQLVLSKSGLKGKYINTFPEGNTIQISATSDFIGLNNDSTTLKANVSTDQNFDLLSKGDKTVAFKAAAASSPRTTGYSKMDFSVDVLLPGATKSNPKRIKVVNVVPNKEYEVKLEIEPAINWKSISFETTATSQTGIKATGLNMHQLFSSFSSGMGADLDGKVLMKRLPLYLYSVRPDMSSFAQAQFVGDLKMFYGVGPDAEHITPKTEHGEIVFLSRTDVTKNTMPFTDMPVLKREKNTVISNISEFSPSAHEDIAPMCNSTKNETDGNIFIQYDIQFSNPGQSSSFTVTYEDYKKSGNKTSSIAILAYMEMPLDFTISDDAEISAMKMIGNDGSDLLGRSSQPSPEEQADFLKAISATRLYYESQKIPFYGNPAANIVIDMDGASNSFYEPISLSFTKGSVEIYDYTQLLSTYPLVPQVSIVLHKGEFTLPREVVLSTRISLNIEMDCNSTITLWGK